jgi:hypothetical protein
MAEREENDASVARAARLREIIREQVGGSDKPEPAGAQGKTSIPRSPRDAIAERMRELGRKE